MPFGVSEWFFWLIMAVVFFVAEAASVGLVSIWFAVGSLVALGLSFTGLDFWVQAVVMLAVSTVLLVIFIKNRDRFAYGKNRHIPTNADRIVGREAYVVERIDRTAGTGQVRVGGQIWSAQSLVPETVFETGRYVRVHSLNGVHAIVEALVDPSKL